MTVEQIYVRVSVIALCVWLESLSESDKLPALFLWTFESGWKRLSDCIKVKWFHSTTTTTNLMD